MQVIRRDDAAHIVHHEPSRTTAYALWNPADFHATENEQLLSASNPCLAMVEQKDDDQLILSLTNPDLRPNESTHQQLTLKLRSSYTIDKNPSGSTSSLEDGNTIITAPILHAESITLILKKKGN